MSAGPRNGATIATNVRQEPFSHCYEYRIHKCAPRKYALRHVPGYRDHCTVLVVTQVRPPSRIRMVFMLAQRGTQLT